MIDLRRSATDCSSLFEESRSAWFVWVSAGGLSFPACVKNVLYSELLRFPNLLSLAYYPPVRFHRYPISFGDIPKAGPGQIGYTCCGC